MYDVLYLLYVIAVCIWIGSTPSPEQHPEMNIDVATAAREVPAPKVSVPKLAVVTSPQEMPDQSMMMLEQEERLIHHFDDLLVTLKKAKRYAVIFDRETQSVCISSRGNSQTIIHAVSLFPRSEAEMDGLLKSADASIRASLRQKKKDRF